MATQFGQATFGGSGGLSFPDYLRPDADDLDGNWTQETGATNLFQSIDEKIADDSDYIKSGINPVADVCRVRLSDPGENVRSPARVRVRYKRFGDAANLIVRLKQGTTEIASWTYASIPNVFTTATEVLTDAQFAAITDFTNLFLEFQADAEDTTYYVVDYANIKVVSYPYDEISDSDVHNWYRRVLREGGSVSAGRLTTVSALVTGLKSDGVWSKLDRLWLFAAENQTSALVDLVGGTLATVVGSPTFTTDRGFTSNTAGTAYLDSNYNPSLNAINLSLNSAHIGSWCVAPAVSTDFVTLGAASSGTQLTEYYQNSTGKWTVAINDSTNLFTVSVVSTGHIVGVRSASNAKAIYVNGISDNTSSSSSTSIPLVNIWLGRENGTAVGGEQFAASHIGGSLTNTDVSNFYSRLRTYMTAVGVP